MDSPDHDIAIAVRNLGKCYRIYDRPQDRLKQALFRGRRQYFREFWAVRDVSLEIRRGETVGIIGRNGCGKSTLLQMICNTLRPSTGAVEIHGRVAALLELGAGFSPEFSGRDNVYTNAAVLGLSPQQIQDRFDDIVAFSELEEFIDRPVKTYSSGMFVRLAFAVAISVDPDILVVDEALAVGDEAFTRKCFARIQEIQRRGGTILFVSHSTAAVVDLCNRAVLLDQGERLLTGTPKAVVARYHKLLYAPAGKAAVIREAIRREDQGLPLEGGGGILPDAAVAEPPPPVIEQSRAYLDPHMQSKSLVEYETHGAEILEPRITTPCGREVNVLVPNEEYVVRYRVRFTADAYQVRFGTLIKNLRGTDLTGMARPRLAQPGEEFVPAGTVAELSFHFRCAFMPGVYFANTGVMGAVDGKIKYLHRLVDRLMFRVQDTDVRGNAGDVDLFLQSQLELLAPGESRIAA